MIHSIGHDIAYFLDTARVSRSGYYQWKKRQKDEDPDLHDYHLIEQIFKRSHAKAGWRTIQMKLSREYDIIMNHKKIQRIKRKYGLVTKIRRARPYMRILKANKEHRTASNLLERRFDHPTPYEFFCTDITYLYFRGVPSYLSVIKDVASGEVVSFELSRHIDMALVVSTLDTLKQTLTQRGICSKNLLIHSDQGSTYTSPIFRSALADLKMVPSMSRKGNCWDNASIESFFGHLKDDIDYQKCRSFDELKALVSKYIEYYNTE